MGIKKVIEALPVDRALRGVCRDYSHQVSDLPEGEQLKGMLSRLRRWLAERVVLLIFTGILGYALYYYFKAEQDGSRNIFTVLGEVGRVIKALSTQPECYESVDSDTPFVSFEAEAAPRGRTPSVDHSAGSAPKSRASQPVEKGVKALRVYPPKDLLKKLKNTPEQRYDHRWLVDKKLIDAAVECWCSETRREDLLVLQKALEQPLKEINHLLLLRYHPDKAAQAGRDLSEAEKAVFAKMLNYIKTIGERLSCVGKEQDPVAHHSWSTFYANFEQAMRDLDERIAAVRKQDEELSKINEENRKKLSEIDQDDQALKKAAEQYLQNQEEVKKAAEQYFQNHEALIKMNERQTRELKELVAENERQDVEQEKIVKGVVCLIKHTELPKNLKLFEANPDNLVALRRVIFCRDFLKRSKKIQPVI